MTKEIEAIYDESSIRVLKGLEPVRERPGMYTRTQDPLHIVQEVIDNAADEALAGHARRIDVHLESDGAVLVLDDGRGIPVGLHPEEKVPVVELAFTRLHAGGKFDKTTGGAYAFAGGLHGVGVAVSCALSSRLEVQVCRGGQRYAIDFSDGGRVISPVRGEGPCGPDERGTAVRLWPDPKYFDSPKIPVGELERLLRSKAVLLPGVRVSLSIDGAAPRSWEYPGGLAQYLGEMAGPAAAVAPLYVAEQYVVAAQGSSATAADQAAAGAASFAPGEGAAFAFGWFPDGGVGSESYVNLIPTPAGGTHESGLKAGVFEAVKSFIDQRALLPRGIRLQQDDVAAKMGYVLSAKVLDPQFQGQIKEKLNSRGAARLVALMVRDRFEVWLNGNIEAGKAIAEVSIRQAMARQKSAERVEKRKGSGVTMLPGKLTDCDGAEGELFLVEGDSAGGSAKMARDKETQAILPLRGKVVNTWEIDPGRLFANNEIHDISVAIGVEPHTIDAPRQQVLAGLRYSRIMIMTDADVDGAHIQVLLLTLFYRHFPHVLAAGHVHVVLPPLFRIDVAPSGKKPGRRQYALDIQERDAMLAQLTREGVRSERIEIGRFKGLGEMNPDQLKETSMDPNSRRALPMQYDPLLLGPMNARFQMMMAKSEAAQRRDWLAVWAHLGEADI